MNLPISFLAALLGCAYLARAELPLPVDEGTTWEYEVTRTGANEVSRSTLTVKIHGKEASKGKQLLRVDTSAGADLVKSELLAVEATGVWCFERTLGNGRTIPFDPPQTVLPAPLKVGAKWELDDVAAGNEMHQQISVVGEEDVVVPAGKFHAFRLQCAEPWPLSVTIERWFVPGTGFVKDVVTTRGPGGRLLDRVTTALAKFSRAEATATKSAAPSTETALATATSPSPPQLKVEVANARDGAAVTEFRSDTSNIFVRWSGQNLPINSGVRIAWIAEDVGDVAPANFVVDETETLVTTSDFGARFTLSRPKDGWAPGKYRIELYLEDELLEKLSVTIRE